MPEDPEKSGGEPNLELPSLFGRRRKKRRRTEAAPTQAPEDVTTEEAPAPSGPTPVQGSSRRLPPTPPPTDDTVPVRASALPADPDVEPVPAPAPVPQPSPEPAEPTPVPPGPEPVPPVPPVPAPEPPAPVPAPEPAPAPVPVPGPLEPEPTPFPPEPEPRPVSVEETSVLPDPVSTVGAANGHAPLEAPLFADEEPGRRRAVKQRTPVTLPRVNGRVAAAVSGLVVGLVGVLLSYGASQGCEAVRGVGSCGGTGLFALLAVVLIQVLLGSLLLRAFGLTDPTSTSFLGVGLVAVLALLFFLSSLESVWMLLVIPLLTAITFLISWWVTETFIEEGADDNLHR